MTRTATPARARSAAPARAAATPASDGASAMLRAFETMRRIQEQAGVQAFERHKAALDRMLMPCDPVEFIRLQRDLAQADVRQVVDYWQQLAGAALEIQAEWAASAFHQVDSEPLLEAGSFARSLQPWSALFKPAGQATPVN